MINEVIDITILSDLSGYLLPLTTDEYADLEKNILLDGCRDPLVLWETTESKFILIDGHNRYSICKKHNIPFGTHRLSFGSIDDVKGWMIDNQLGRRNLNAMQLSYYRGLKYLSVKKSKGGYENVRSKGQNELSTGEVLSELYNVSESTIKRDARFAGGLEVIGQCNPKLKADILLGQVKIDKSDIQILADVELGSALNLRGRSEVVALAEELKSKVLDEVEGDVKRLRQERIEKAKDILQSREPLFLERADRLTKIKGMILAEINTAINEKNVEAIQKLRKLIELLEHELFD